VLTLVATSPFYIFWSRAFMIESTALFFSLAYLALLLRALRAYDESRRWLLVATGLTGSLAGMIKVTTFVTFFLAGIAAIAWGWWKRRQSGNLTFHIKLFLAASALPFLITSAWTHYADSVKAKSPMTAWLTSTALTAWTFGPVGQRFHPGNYHAFGPVIDSLLGNRIVFALILLGLVFVRGRRREIAICLALWASNILIFFNLHYIHSYYAYANGIFLIAALGFLIVALYERGGGWRWAAAYMLAFCMGAFAVRFFLDFYGWQRFNGSSTGAAADVLKRVTDPEDVLLIYGLDWSPELPYLAHRRAIMNRYGFGDHPGLPFTLSHLAPRKLGAVLMCGIYRNSAAPMEDLLTRLSFGNRYATASDCDIYLPRNGPSPTASPDRVGTKAARPSSEK